MQLTKRWQSLMNPRMRGGSGKLLGSGPRQATSTRELRRSWPSAEPLRRPDPGWPQGDQLIMALRQVGQLTPGATSSGTVQALTCDHPPPITDGDHPSIGWRGSFQ